jgi:hypothetical protein
MKMNREQLMALIGDTSVSEIESLLVKFKFDYSLKEHRVNNCVYYEIGRNDADIPIVIDPDAGSVSFLDRSGLSFINSSFCQMLQSLREVNSWEHEPDTLTNEQRTKRSSRALLAIDPNCFDDEDGCWSVILEEITLGMI